MRGQVLLTHLDQISWEKERKRGEKNEKRERKEERFYSEKLSLLSRFTDDQTDDFKRSKGKS